MINKKKICSNCLKEEYIWKSVGRNKFCRKCSNILFPVTIKKKEYKPIKKVSKKQSYRNQKYLKLREEYLENHKLCEVCKEREATDIHHKAGRIGDNLFKHFLAVDRECHKWIEEHPEQAKELGYSISRLC